MTAPPTSSPVPAEPGTELHREPRTEPHAVPHTELHTDPSALVTLADDWRALSRRAVADEPMNAPPWSSLYFRTFADAAPRCRLALLSVRASSAPTAPLLALWPLAIRRVRALPELPLPRITRLDALGAGEAEADEVCSDYLGPIIAKDALVPACAALAQALATHPRLAFDELCSPAMAADSPIVPALAQALDFAGFTVDTIATAGAPYIALPASFDAYLEALPQQRRYLVRRSLRDLATFAENAHTLHVASDEASLAEGLRVLRSLHSERWTSAGKDGVFASPRFTAFHDQLSRALLAEGALELLWLSVRGQPIAAAYNFVWANKVYFYQAGRRMDLPGKLRPGMALHALAIQRAIAAGRREYDFLAGESRYKLDLATAVRPLVTLRVTRRGLRSFALDTARALRLRARNAYRARRASDPAPAADPNPDRSA